MGSDKREAKLFLCGTRARFVGGELFDIELASLEGGVLLFSLPFRDRAWFEMIADAGPCEPHIAGDRLTYPGVLEICLFLSSYRSSYRRRFSSYSELFSEGFLEMASR